MSSLRRQELSAEQSWRFWRLWMLVSAVGFGLGWLLGFFVAQAGVGVAGVDFQGGTILGRGGYLIAYGCITGAIPMLREPASPGATDGALRCDDRRCAAGIGFVRLRVWLLA